MSPLDHSTYVADLAHEFGYPLIVVAPNRVGVINQVVQTILVAEKIYGLSVLAVVLNTLHQTGNERDPSVASNLASLEAHCNVPIYSLVHDGEQFEPHADWHQLAQLPSR